MSFFRKALLVCAVVLITLASAPALSAAEVRPIEVRASGSVLDWVSVSWNKLTAWFAGAVVQPPPSGPAPTTDGRCEVDPNGCPEGQ